MAYSATTWTTGDTITQALANNWETQYTEAVGLAAVSWTREACRAYRSAGYTLSVSTEWQVALDAEDIDTATMHDNSTNPERITVPTNGDGYWHVYGQLVLDNPGTNHDCTLTLYVNGTGGTVVDVCEHPSCTSGTADRCWQVHWVGSLSATDYVQMGFIADYTGVVLVGSPNTYLFAHRIR